MRQLENKVAIVHGAGGLVGAAVARAFAAEGAIVHLTGRRPDPLAATQRVIGKAGGRSQAHELDVTNGPAVRQTTDRILADEGRIDVLYNAVTYAEVQGTPLHALEAEAVQKSVSTATRAHLHTVSAVVPAMSEQGAGVIQTMVGNGPPHPLMGSTSLAWHLIEGLYRQFAVELGGDGIRVQWFRTGGFRETPLAASDHGPGYAGDITPEEELAELQEATMLNRLPSVTEAGAFAAFAAGEHGSSLTAAAFNLTSGAVSD